MDALSQVLSSVRMEASVFSRAQLAAPWAVHTGGLDGGMFHVVVRGSGELRRADDPPRAWRAGDLLVLPRGDAHEMASAPGVRARALTSLPAEVGEDGLPCVRSEGDGEETLLLCGSFRVHHAARAFVVGQLPEVLHVQPALDSTATWIDASLRMLTAEQLDRAPGSAALSARLAEALFIQVLRAFARQSGPAAGWLAALFDPHLGPALTAVHADPRAPWSAGAMARRAGLSRSAFFERFRAVVGEAPATYLTRWRMVVGRVALSEGCSLAQAAERAGYGSEASFSRAFKRSEGVSPGAWRAGVS